MEVHYISLFFKIYFLIGFRGGGERENLCTFEIFALNSLFKVYSETN